MIHYGINRPLSSHWRRATCAEMDCPQYLFGFETLIDEATQFGQHQAAYIRHQSGRHFTEERQASGLTRFVFPAGQRCFREHKIPLEREPILTRASLGDKVVLERGRWVEDFNENSERINKQRKEG